MTALRVLLTALAAALFLATFATASEWVTEGSSRLRLVTAAPAADGSLRAGLEMRLAPGWKTYWINPGPTGLAPKFDWSGSDNLGSAEPLWPLPVRFRDGNSDAIGYSGTLLVPIRVVPLSAGRPVRLKLRLDYGLCERLCVPASTDLAVDLVPGARTDAFVAAELAGFEARVPKPARLGGSGPLAVTEARREGDALLIALRVPAGAKNVDVFASAAKGFVGLPKAEAGSTWRIALRADDLPPAVDLVATADGQAIAVPVPLDDPAARP